MNERTYETFNGQVLFEELERITQSKEDIDIDDTFVITMHVFNNFEGKGGRFKKYFDDQLKVAAHVVGDGKCLPSAVALGMAFLAFKLEKDENQKKKNRLYWDKLIHKKVFIFCMKKYQSKNFSTTAVVKKFKVRPRTMY